MIGSEETPAKHVKYAWSDAWVLLAVIYAARETGRADIVRIIAVADAVNHAIVTHGELDEGLARLIEGGYIDRAQSDFRASEVSISAYKEAAASISGRSQLGVITELAGFLKVEHLAPSSRPPQIGSGRVITLRAYKSAVEEYQSRFREPGQTL